MSVRRWREVHYRTDLWSSRSRSSWGRRCRRPLLAGTCHALSTVPGRRGGCSHSRGPPSPASTGTPLSHTPRGPRTAGPGSPLRTETRREAAVRAFSPKQKLYQPRSAVKCILTSAVCGEDKEAEKHDRLSLADCAPECMSVGQCVKRSVEDIVEIEFSHWCTGIKKPCNQCAHT